jgi:tripartite-type tricarboxylate transporter receptor subunit TctC
MRRTPSASRAEEDVIFIAIKDLSQGMIGKAVDGTMTEPRISKAARRCSGRLSELGLQRRNRMLQKSLYAFAASIVLAASSLGYAQSYPAKPIRFLVGFPPSGTNDIVARIVAQKVSELIGQQLVVENRGGANTAIATELGARAAPDGYTILLNSPGHATNPALMKLNFDSVKDFAFITLIAEAPNLVVVHPSLPARNVKELIAVSKKQPGQINYGSSGTGTTVHLSAELFQHMTGVKWVHIPYKGGGPAVIELMAGQTQVYFGNLPTVIGYARAGKLRPLAVTSAKRSAAAPEIPTVAESGVPGFDVTAWYGVSVPAKTPKPLVDRLNTEFVNAIKSPDLRDRLVKAGADPVGNTPEQYTAFVQNEITKWGKVIKAAGIKGE